MFRLRLACLAYFGGLLMTLTGCCTFCEDGRMFPRLFRSNFWNRSHYVTDADCECHGIEGGGAPVFEGPMPGPVLTAPGQTVPIPITNMPPNQPPQVVKVPQAPPTPYSPVH